MVNCLQLLVLENMTIKLTDSNGYNLYNMYNIRDIGDIRDRYACHWIAHNPNISCKFIENNLHLEWEYYNILSSNKVSNKIIKAYQHRPIIDPYYPIAIHIKKTSYEHICNMGLILTIWEYQKIPNIWDLFLNTHNNGWDCIVLTKEYVTSVEHLKIISLFPDKKWDFIHLSQLKFITWDIVLAFPKIKWNYDFISTLPSISWKIICENSHLLNNYEYISSNPNITYDIIKNNPDKKWYLRNLFSNEFKHDKYVVEFCTKKLIASNNKIKIKTLQILLQYKIRIPRLFI